MPPVLVLKYRDELAALGRLPPPDSFPPNSLPAVRFAHNPFIEADGLPVGVLQPGRFPPGSPADWIKFALSVFDTKDHAKARLEYLKRTNPMIERKLGDHLVSATLMPDDGLVTKIDRKGHFSLFESADFSVQTRFSGHEPIHA